MPNTMLETTEIEEVEENEVKKITPAKKLPILFDSGMNKKGEKGKGQQNCEENCFSEKKKVSSCWSFKFGW